MTFTLKNENFETIKIAKKTTQLKSFSKKIGKKVPE